MLLSEKPKSYELEKTVQSLNFFLNQVQSKHMSKMKLLKLLFLADRYTIRNYGYSLSSDIYYALENGPIGTTTKDILDGAKVTDYTNDYIWVVSDRDIRSKKPVKFEEFSETDLSALRTVWSVYGAMSPFELRDYTHKFPEWLRFKDRLESKTLKQAKIHPEDFFADPPQKPHKYIFNQDQTTLEVNKELFEYSKELKSIFEA